MTLLEAQAMLAELKRGRYFERCVGNPLAESGVDCETAYFDRRLGLVVILRSNLSPRGAHEEPMEYVAPEQYTTRLSNSGIAATTYAKLLRP